MNIYPYKTIKAGKFTKWVIYVTTGAYVVIEKQFRGKVVSMMTLKQGELKEAKIPQNIKDSIKWAFYEMRTGMNF